MSRDNSRLRFSFLFARFRDLRPKAGDKGGGRGGGGIPVASTTSGRRPETRVVVGVVVAFQISYPRTGHYPVRGILPLIEGIHRAIDDVYPSSKSLQGAQLPAKHASRRRRPKSILQSLHPQKG